MLEGCCCLRHTHVDFALSCLIARPPVAFLYFSVLALFRLFTCFATRTPIEFLHFTFMICFWVLALHFVCSVLSGCLSLSVTFVAFGCAVLCITSCLPLLFVLFQCALTGNDYCILRQDAASVLQKDGKTLVVSP